MNFYFATGSADLAPGAAEALAVVIQGMEAGTGDGFGLPRFDRRRRGERGTGQAARETVRDVLIGLGVPADNVDLQKPPRDGRQR